MKIKKLVTALATTPFGIAAALTVSGSAPYYGNSSSYGTAALSPNYLPRVDTLITNNFRPNKEQVVYRKQKSNALQLQGGVSASPGRVLGKEERRKRTHPSTEPRPDKHLEERQADDMTFEALYQKIKAWPLLLGINTSLEDNLAPEAASSSAKAIEEAGIRPHLVRHLIVLVIAFLIVFGALYQLVNYLLLATRASAQCSLSTVFVTVPVTQTYTTSIFVSPTACTTSPAEVGIAATDSTSLSTVVHTSTSTSTLFTTTTLTVFSVSPSGSSITTSSTTPFVFEVHSGTTSWINGVSPSSGASLVTATTTITVTPVAPTTPLKTSTTTIQSTNTHTTTITPPAEVSTFTSFISPDLTSTVHITRTSTVSFQVTSTRWSFGGVGSSGWNVSSPSTSSNDGSVTAAAAEGVPTTATVSFFWASSGGQTYSTSTKIITTTIYHSIPFGSTGLSAETPGVVSVTTASSVLPSSRSILNGSSSTLPATAPGTGGISATAGPSPSASSSAIQPASESTSLASTQSPSANAPSTGSESASFSNDTATSTASTKSDAIPASINSLTTSSGPSHASATLSHVSTFNSPFPSISGASSDNMTTPATVPGLLTSAATSTTGDPIGGAIGSATSEVTSTGASSVSGTLSTSTTLPYTSPVAYSSIEFSASPADVSSSSSLGVSHSTISSSAGLVSAAPSTSLLSAIGSSLANGPASVASSSLDSARSSAKTTSSTGPSLSNGQTSTSPVGRSSPSSSTSPESSSTFGLTASTGSSTPMTTSSSRSSSSSFNSVSASSASVLTTLSVSKTSASAAPTPTACGEHGDFVLNFDDLPSFSGDEDITQAPPIFSPYHHLTFSNGYVHAPQNKQPFAPHSGDQLAVFLASGNGTNGTNWHQNGMSANVPRTEPGEITDGPYDGLPAYWFDAKGAWLGCDNDGPDPCLFNVTGWTWDSQASDEVATYNTQIEVPPCPGFEGCKLQHVNFPDNFRGLSGISIQAFENNKPRMFFMDDLALSWHDNSCEAGMQRMGRPGSSGGPGRSGSSGGGRKRVVRRSLMP